MTSQEQHLIASIKALPNHQVFPGSLGHNIVVVHTRPNGVSQSSVWLGRSSTIPRLQSILSASQGA